MPEHPEAVSSRRASSRPAARRAVVRRAATLIMLIALAFGLGSTAAIAAPATQDAAMLGALWTKVLETPSAQNSFGSGGQEFACWDLGQQVVAPFGPNGVASCTVKPGTRLFVAASTFECSTFEGNGTTEQQLRDCARQSDAQVAPPVTLDGSPVPVTEVETALLPITLPADNIFGQPAGTTGQSVAHGWVTSLLPLTPGTHTIVIGGATVITTKIIVKPGV